VELHAFEIELAVRSPWITPSSEVAVTLNTAARTPIDGQRVIARRRETVRQSLEDALTVVLDERRLPVHQRRRVHDAGADRLRHRLVADETPSTGRTPAIRRISSTRCRLRQACTGRRHDECVDLADAVHHLVDRYHIVADDLDLRADLLNA